jgi:hypothetical protein
MITIIIGMHRSGTSALSGLLHTNGIVMGEEQDFNVSNDSGYHEVISGENQKGFYENSRFRSLNDLILSQNGYFVHRFSPYVPDNITMSEEATDIMGQLVSEYHKKYPIWGFKDPRSCLTISLWQQFLTDNDFEYKTILIKRDVDAVVASMQKRGNLGTLQQFKDLAYVYDLEIKSNIIKEITVTIQFEDLINSTADTARFLSNKLDHPITNLSFIDPTLVNQNVSK